MTVRAAAVQTTATTDRDRNVERAEALTHAAVRDGAELVVLPELWNVFGTPAVLRAGAETLDGPTSTWAATTARGHGIWLLAGSIPEAVEGSSLIHNTSCLYGPGGERVATYRKVHLFDNDVPGAAYTESATVSAGDELVTASACGTKLGLAICYDLRFPELFRILALRGAAVFVLPAWFTAVTGRAHWEVLLRARAIENACFVVAADQVGTLAAGSGGEVSAYGHSAIVDPWGAVLATAPDGEGHVCADLDLALVDETRRRLPSLANRRPGVYAWPDAAARPPSR
ncbi:MAG: carbon-nitrogen hydrolase family protein [Acidimicrobiia bacterium]